MANKKDNKMLYIGIAAAVAIVLVVVLAIVIPKLGDNGGSGGDGGNTSTTITENDVAHVDVEIEYGDYDGMAKLAKDIQNGEMVGKVVKIDGLVSHPMSTYSIVEPNADGSAKIGTQFVILHDDPMYPEDGIRVVLRGKVIQQNSILFMIETATSLIDVVE